MPAPQLLSNFFKINLDSISKKEQLILEGDLLAAICNELKEYFKKKYEYDLHPIKLKIEKEETMLDTNYIRWMIDDILATDAYTLSGIAYYTQTPEEVIDYIVMGYNIRPSAIFLQRLIMLHQEVNPLLYLSIRKKIVSGYLAVA